MNSFTMKFWNPKQTLQEMSKAAGSTYGQVRWFCKKFNLEYKPAPPGPAKGGTHLYYKPIQPMIITPAPEPEFIIDSKYSTPYQYSSHEPWVEDKPFKRKKDNINESEQGMAWDECGVLV